MPSVLVNTNVPSLVAQVNLNRTTKSINDSFTKLSTGIRLNTPFEDPAGYTVAKILKTQIQAFQAASSNAQDGISVLQIAEGTLGVVTDSLQRIRELTVQAANDVNTDQQRNAIENEIQARMSDIQRIVTASSYNGVKLLTGSAVNTRFQIGPDSSVGINTLNIASALAKATATALGVLGTTTSAGFNTISAINFASAGDARKFLSDLDSAIDRLSARRSKIGAFQNQLDAAIENLDLNAQNFTATESRIRDLDIASETAALTQSQILQQAAINILDQANRNPERILALLQR